MNVIAENNFEEAILKSEPLDNTYSIIEPGLMNIFPYFILGTLKCKFLIGNKIEKSQGVGFLIGDDLILTSAHNLYCKVVEDKNEGSFSNYNKISYVLPKKIEFSFMNNGKFKLFEPMLCDHYIIPEEYKEMKNDPYESQGQSVVKYDYALVFLPKGVGNFLTEFSSSFNYFNKSKISSKNLLKGKINKENEIINNKNNPNNCTTSLQNNNHTEFLFDPVYKFFNYFEDHISKFESLENKNKKEQGNVKNEKISENKTNIPKSLSNLKMAMISYTTYNSDYVNSSLFKYNSSFYTFNKKSQNLFSRKIKDQWDQSNTNIFAPKNKFTERITERISLNSTCTMSNNQNFLNQNSQINQSIQLSHISNIKDIGEISSINNISISNYNKTIIRTVTGSDFNLTSISENTSNFCENLNQISQNNFPNYKNFQNMSNNKFFIFKNSISSERIENYKTNFDSIFYSENQSVICEARGRFFDNENSENLTYIISTYAGQSGSPIFLRLKKKNLHTDSSIGRKYNSDEFEYILVGIHSRCPLIESSINNLSNFENSQNLSSNEFNLTNSTVNLEVLKNSFIGVTGISPYNLGVRLNSKILVNLKNLVLQKRSEISCINLLQGKGTRILNSSLSGNLLLNFFYSQYVFINVFIYGDVLFQGIFKKEIDLFSLFFISEGLLEIKSNFLILKNPSNDKNFYFGDKIKIFEILKENYESNISINEEQKSDNNNQCSHNIEEIDLNKISNISYFNFFENLMLPKLSLHLEVDINSLGLNLKNKIFNKLRDYDEGFERKIKKKNKKFQLGIVKNIFDEINYVYKKSIYLHGLLFKDIKEKIFSHEMNCLEQE
jgi:hypothetical protein